MTFRKLLPRIYPRYITRRGRKFARALPPERLPLRNAASFIHPVYVQVAAREPLAMDQRVRARARVYVRAFYAVCARV